MGVFSKAKDEIWEIFLAFTPQHSTLKSGTAYKKLVNEGNHFLGFGRNRNLTPIGFAKPKPNRNPLIETRES